MIRLPVAPFKFSICAIALSVFGVGNGFADTLVMAEGQRLRGKVVNVSEISVIAIVNGTETVFPRRSISSIEFEGVRSKSSTGATADVTREIARGQTTQFRISSWDYPKPNDPNTYGVFLVVLNELKLSGKEPLNAGSVVFGKIKLQQTPNGKLQFVKELESGFDARQFVRLTHGPVSPLRVLNPPKSVPAAVTYSAGDPEPPPGTPEEIVKALGWLKVGNVVEWTFLSK
jgi:hypothetical protein